MYDMNAFVVFISIKYLKKKLTFYNTLHVCDNVTELYNCNLLSISPNVCYFGLGDRYWKLEFFHILYYTCYPYSFTPYIQLAQPSVSLDTGADTGKLEGMKLSLKNVFIRFFFTMTILTLSLMYFNFVNCSGLLFSTSRSVLDSTLHNYCVKFSIRSNLTTFFIFWLIILFVLLCHDKTRIWTIENKKLPTEKWRNTFMSF